MVYKQGKFGKFLACPGFPECRNTKAITVELGVPCPKCGGKVFDTQVQKGRHFMLVSIRPSVILFPGMNLVMKNVPNAEAYL